ncbi:protein kinase domain-containing protein [Nostoc sp. DSM 114167]|jgi:serine/threonine protein kinase|uniref:protein kinase domain-containing protein n=1 Tax=Nostoc sp. DSM 114167 TaxID=3439050 RepID=UPI0040465EEC
MSLCINPNCQNTDNPDNLLRCQSCGSELLLEGRYRVTRLLSDKGGYGDIYEIRDRSGIPKVLKVLKEEKKNDAKAVEQFQREAEVLSKLNHPGIPQGEEYFTFSPINNQQLVHCLVMEKIEGENLHEWLEKRVNRPISEKLAVDWLIQLVNTLHEVHQQQLIHRDIKPSNIMLKPNGQLALIDFGIARGISETYEQKKMAGQGTRVVSDGYSPLEQATGSAIQQSDFFALGRTFVHLITGIHPFDLCDQYNHDIYTDELEDWRQKAPKISALLADLIDKLMARPFNKRPANTQVILQKLAEISESLYSPKLYQSKSYSQIFTVNNPIISLEYTLGSWYSGHSSWINSIAISPDGQTLISAGNDMKIKVWNLKSKEEIFTITLDPDIVKCLIISPDGHTLFSGSTKGLIQAWNITTGEEIHTFTEHSYQVFALVISPDGQTLFSGSSDIKIWNLNNNELVRTLNIHSRPVLTIAISPDGKTLVSGSEDKSIKIWSICTLTGHLADINSVVISPDGNTVISGSKDKTIKVWNMNSKEEIYTLRGHLGAVHSVAISQDGQTLASGSSDEKIKLWNLSTGEEIYTLTGHSDAVTSLVFSPDGQTLVSGSQDSTIKVWQIQ